MSTKWDIKLYLRDLLGAQKRMCSQLQAHTAALVMNVFSRTHYTVYRRYNEELQRTYIHPPILCVPHTNQSTWFTGWEVTAPSLRKNSGELEPEKGKATEGPSFSPAHNPPDRMSQESSRCSDEGQKRQANKPPDEIKVWWKNLFCFSKSSNCYHESQNLRSLIGKGICSLNVLTSDPIMWSSRLCTLTVVGHFLSSKERPFFFFVSSGCL